MKRAIKKAAALLSVVAMCGTMFLNFPENTFVLSAFSADSGVAINEDNFPDEFFRNRVMTFDTSRDNILSDEEIARVDEITVCSPYAYDFNLPPINVTSLKGIEYFTSLTRLDCRHTTLTKLDVSNNSALITLDCSSNQLNSLTLGSNSVLTKLFCGGNQLTNLDVSNNTALTGLYCGNNQLTSLDVSNNTALTDLYCNGNQLTNLDVSNNNALITLDCHNNRLNNLDVSNHSALAYLHCYYNQLTSLDASNDSALASLSCYDNQLTSLDISNDSALTSLFCEDNRLSSLDVSNNSALTQLQCYGNHLTSIDLSNNNNLGEFECEQNTYEITVDEDSYDLSELPKGFDVSKTSNWTNATVNDNILTIIDLSKPVTYDYDTGYTGDNTDYKKNTFTLNLKNTSALLGDVNGDGILNSVDASAILTYYAILMTEQTPTMKFDTSVADYNGDGIINAIDASAILTYYANSMTSK